MRRTDKIRKTKKINRAVVHERTKQEREEKQKIRLAPFFILVLTGGLIYLIIFSDAFTIKETRVEGYKNPELIKEIIKSHTEESVLSRNIFFLNKESVESAIKGDRSVRSVEITRVFPNTIAVNVVQSIPAILWGSAGEYFEIDERGYVVSKAQNENNLPVVYDEFNITPALGERVASPTLVNYIITLDENFTKVTGEEKEKIFIYNLLSDIRVKSMSSWTAYFNVNKDPVAQLENLVKILNEAKAGGRTRLEYIDMRLEDKIFYR